MSSIYSNDSSIGDGDVIGDALTVSNGLAVVREIAMVPSLLPSPWSLSLPSLSILCALTIMIAMKIQKCITPSVTIAITVNEHLPRIEPQNRIDDGVIADLFSTIYSEKI